MVKGKVILLLFLGIFLIGNVLALDSLGTFKQGLIVNISQVCDGATFITISDLKYPNSSSAQNPINMTSVGNGKFFYPFQDTNALGKYDVLGISNGCDKTFATYFYITPNGEELTTSNSILYLGFISLLLFLFVLTIFGITSIPDSEERDDTGKLININNLKYFKGLLFLVAWVLLLATFFVSSNVALAYLSSAMFGKVLFVLYKIMFIGLIPFLILWVVWLISNLFSDKETKNMIERGVNFGGDI